MEFVIPAFVAGNCCTYSSVISIVVLSIFGVRMSRRRRGNRFRFCRCWNLCRRRLRCVLPLIIRRAHPGMDSSPFRCRFRIFVSLFLCLMLQISLSFHFRRARRSNSESRNLWNVRLGSSRRARGASDDLLLERILPQADLKDLLVSFRITFWSWVCFSFLWSSLPPLRK